MPASVVVSLTLLNVTLSILAALAHPQQARAQDLQAAEAALLRGQYPQARDLAQEAIAAGTRTGSELVMPYRVLALANGYLDDADAATHAFTSLLALDPDYRLPDGLPAEVRSPFMEARGFWLTHEGSLSSEVAFAEDRGSLAIILNDPAALSARVRVRARAEGTSKYLEFVRAPNPALRVAIEGLADAQQVDYSIALLDEHGNRLWQRGSDARPLHLSRPRVTQLRVTQGSTESPLAVASANAPTEREGAQASGERRRPYLAFGGILLAGGVGAAVAGAFAHAKREELAGRWNRGDCTGPGVTRASICASEKKDITQMTKLSVGLYASSAVALLSGLTLLLIAPGRADQRPATSMTTAWRCGHGPFQLGLMCSRGF